MVSHLQNKTTALFKHYALTRMKPRIGYSLAGYGHQEQQHHTSFQRGSHMSPQAHEGTAQLRARQACSTQVTQHSGDCLLLHQHKLTVGLSTLFPPPYTNDTQETFKAGEPGAASPQHRPNWQGKEQTCMDEIKAHRSFT